MATPTIRDSFADSDYDNLTLTTDPDTEVGDWLLVIQATDYYTAADLVEPTDGDWTLVAEEGNPGSGHPHIKAWVREVTVAGANSVTVAQAINSGNHAHLYVLSGVVAVDDGTGDFSNASATSHSAPSADAVGADDLLIVATVGLTDGSAAFDYTAPSGMAKIRETDVSTWSTMASYTQTLPSSGPTGIRVATASIAVEWAAVSLTFRGVPSNTAPRITAIDIPSVELGEETTASVTAEDDQTLVGAEYEFDWGDGSSPTVVSVPTANHTYAAPGDYDVVVTVTDAGDLSDSDTAVATVVGPNTPPRITSLTIPPAVLGEETTVTLVVEDDETLVDAEYEFDWGDGSAPTVVSVPTATHTYAALGTWPVLATVTDAEGLSDHRAGVAAVVSANTPPRITALDIPAVILGSATTASVTAEDDQTLVGAEYRFDWGDGAAVTVTANPFAVHTYTTPGLWAVLVTVTDAEGLTDSQAGIASVATGNTAPRITSLSTPTVALGSPTTATATVEDDQTLVGATYRFEWGDGSPPTTVAVPTATHTYAAAGNYPVLVVVTDAEGLDDSQAGVAAVTSGNTAPRITSLTIPPVTLGAATTATAVAADDETLVGATYRFEWGDGTAATVGSAATATHTYATAGQWPVLVTVTDAGGLSDSHAGIASVATGNTAPRITALTIPPAVVGAATTVTATVEDDQTLVGAEYRFEWGDGTAATVTANPTATHTYASAGHWAVLAMVTDAGGLSDSHAGVAVVNPVANTAPRITSLSIPDVVRGTATTATATVEDDQTLVGATYRFDWGDGTAVTVSSTPTATHTYVAAGDWPVLVTVTDAGGLSDYQAGVATVSVPVTQTTDDCEPWPLRSECLPQGWLPNPPQWTDAQRDAVLVAAELLNAFSGGQYGLCRVTVRPCKASLALRPNPTLPGGPWMTPVLLDGRLINLGCACVNSGCACAPPCEVVLPDVVHDIIEVRMDGLVVPSTAYRVDDNRKLVRTDGGCWPLTQNLELPATETGTWSITYRRGTLPGPAGELALTLLAIELYKACHEPKGCQLPRRVSQIVREGVTYDLLDDLTIFDRSRTGIPRVDMWLAAVNPYGARTQMRVWSPDLPTPRQTTWP